MITLLLALVAFLAGFIDSIAGGGGLLTVPSFILAGIPPQNALATNKLVSSLGTSTAVINFARKKKIVWKIVAFGIAFSLIGSSIGSRAILMFNNTTVGKIIIFLLPIILVITLIPKKNGKKTEEISPKKLFIFTALICLTIGFYDGFFGPGTGSLLILAFHFLIGLNLTHASGTAKAFNLASNIGGLIVFILNGKVLFLIGLPLAAANIAGNYFGSHLAIQHGEKIIRGVLLLSLGILFISLVVKYY